MKKIQWLAILMGITLVIIIAFQLYWLKDSYDREKRALQIKTAVSFQETVQQLQAQKLRLPGFSLSTRANDDNKKVIGTSKITVKTPASEKSKSNIVVNRKMASNTKMPEIIKLDTAKKVFIISYDNDSNTFIRTTQPIRYKYDSALKSQEIFVEEGFNMEKPRRQVITMVNTMRRRLQDTMKTVSFSDKNLIIHVRKDSNRIQQEITSVKLRKVADTNSRAYKELINDTNHFYKVLYTVDSLQDSLSLREIIKAYSGSLKDQNLKVPFTISKLQGAAPDAEQDMANITVGFAHPVTYHLSLDSVMPFLIKKLTLPILFSIFLIGVTILSFFILYSNLLKQQRLGDIKNEFISNITHELKTPISTVSVAIEAMKNFNALQNPQRTAEYLDIAENELQRLTMLVDKVLKLSMFEQQQIELKYEKFDVGKLTAEVLKSMRLQFEKYKANVVIESKGNDFNIRADRLHITSVLYNLLDNALKYSNDNPEVNILIEEKNKEIQLSIADKGKGIPTEYKDKVFEKFFRVPHGDAHNIKGYGLGLSYVSHIIAQHKGTIQVETELGKGSTFIITLPKTNGEN